MNRTFKFLGGLAVVLIVAYIINIAILKGAGYLSLKPAAPLSGAISQSMVSSTSSKGLPIEGKDYSVKSTRYLDNGNWAVVSVSPPNQKSNSAVVILEKTSGAFRVVLGPGTAFSSSSVQNLPQNVIQAIKSLGVPIYTPLGEAPSYDS